MSETAIEVSGLTKDYGGSRGVFGLSFTVQPGEAFGILGPNGAGKTTTIRQLMGFVRPDSGRARIFGQDCFAGAARVQSQVGYLPGELALMDDMTGAAFIRLMAGLRGQKDLNYAWQLCQRFGLDAGQKIRKMSKGTKQKVGLVCALMHRPRLLILDEPTSGLDPLMQNQLWEILLAEKQQGVTILLSSHIFEEVERLCDRAALLRGGRIAAVEQLGELRAKASRVYQLRFAGENEAAAFAAAWPGAAAKGDWVQLQLSRGEPVARLLAMAAKSGVQDLQTRQESLEDMFLRMYGGRNE